MDGTTYIEHQHLSEDVNTVGEFLDQNGLSIAFHYISKVDEFLSYKGDTELTNRERVLKPYTPQERVDNEDKSNSELLLKYGTTLLIPKDNVYKEVLFTEGNQVVETSTFTAFLVKQLHELLSSPQYQLVDKIQSTRGGVVKQIYPGITIWAWCRALGNSTEGDSLLGSFIDITPFVSDIRTNNVQNGGNFTIELAPIICEPDEVEGWGIKKEFIKNYFSSRKKNNYVAESGFHKLDKLGDYKRNQFYFHNVIKSNDLIFIRFETLELELKNRSKEENRWDISHQDIPNKIYDMIGLVDTNSLKVVPGSSDISIHVAGRDLSKVIIEDGCYFFPLEFAGDIFVNNQRNRKLPERMFGRIETLSVYIERSIEFSLKFVINKLSNLGCVPGYVFEPYGTRQSRFFKEVDSTIQEELMDGVWRIIKLVIDKSIRTRRIVDSSIATDSGSILNFINKICQDPFVEFFTDTYGDMFYFIVRQVPFNEVAFKQLAYGGVITEEDKIETTQQPLMIDILEEDIIEENITWDDGQTYSWYQLIPQGLFFGQGSEISLAYLPAIYFSEYCDIWGSRPLSVTTNYISYHPVSGTKQKEQQNFFELQAFEDLKFLIDIHCYLPFTRRGTLVINGDRRIKKGTIIRLKSSDELYYVDGVTQHFSISNGSIDRTTTLQISRGMVEKYVQGVTKDEMKYSYFNIINTQIDKKFKNNKGQFSIEILKDWKVNPKVFNFFLKGNQFKS